MAEGESIKHACKQCDYKTTRQFDLKTHIQSIHESVKYDCYHCDKQLTQKSSLTKHIKSEHDGVKYACKHCDYQAKEQAVLKKHMKRKHFNVQSKLAKEKLICCPECGIPFSNNKKMEAHFLQVHD